MKKQSADFTLEDKILNHLILQTVSVKRNGLFYGKLGIAIVFFECGKHRNNSVYTDYAKELFDSLPQTIDERITHDFATGLCGFGWGLEYIIRHKFADRDNNGACAVIDQRLMEIDMRRMNNLSLHSGLEGFLHYILIRLTSENKARALDDLYLKDTHNRLLLLPNEGISTSLYDLKQIFISYMETGTLTYKPDICLFTNKMEVKNEEEILSAKLGLADGLAGELIIKARRYTDEECFHYR